MNTTELNYAAPNHPVMSGLPGGVPQDAEAGGHLTSLGNATVLSTDGIGGATSYLVIDGCGGAYVNYICLEWAFPPEVDLAPAGPNAIEFLLKGTHDQDEDGYADADCGWDDCDDDSTGDDDSAGDDDSTGPSADDDDSDSRGPGDDCTCRLDRATPGIPTAVWLLAGTLLVMRGRALTSRTRIP